MYCTKCGSEIEKDFLFCQQCGNKISGNKDTYSETPQKKIDINKCSNCGGILAKTAVNQYVCEYCGTKYNFSDSSPSKDKISEQELLETFNRAAKLENQEKYYEELQCLLSISDRVSDNVLALVKIGRAYRRNNMYNKALEYYKKALEINPSYASAYSNIATIYIVVKDYEKAEEYAKLGIELINKDRTGYTQSDFAIAYSNCALAVGYLGKIDEAKKLIEIAEKNGYKNGNIIREKLGLRKKFHL